MIEQVAVHAREAIMQLVLSLDVEEVESVSVTLRLSHIRAGHNQRHSFRRHAIGDEAGSLLGIDFESVTGHFHTHTTDVAVGSE